MKVEGNNLFFKELQAFMILAIISGSISIMLLFQDLYSFLSFLIGSTLAFVNFITLKKEGQDFFI